MEFQKTPGWMDWYTGPSKPKFKLPAGAVDAHCHVFGPGNEFPYAPERKYTPCDASKAQLYALRDHLGFARNVVVQATCHGADNRAMIDAYVYCDVAIIEKYIEGTELAISVIDLGAGPIALPPVEIEPRDGKYGYHERYIAGEANFYVPARVQPQVNEEAARIAIKAHEILGLRHLSRIDMIVDKKGVCWFLEANVAPGLTETSLVPQAIAASGNSLGEVYYSLAEAAKRNL